jgi:hypothetical protein
VIHRALAIIRGQFVWRTWSAFGCVGLTVPRNQEHSVRLRAVPLGNVSGRDGLATVVALKRVWSGVAGRRRL